MARGPAQGHTAFSGESGIQTQMLCSPGPGSQPAVRLASPALLAVGVETALPWLPSSGPRHLAGLSHMTVYLLLGLEGYVADLCQERGRFQTRGPDAEAAAAGLGPGSHSLLHPTTRCSNCLRCMTRVITYCI